MIDKISFTAKVGFFSSPHRRPQELIGRTDNISRLFENKTTDSENRLVVEADDNSPNDTFYLYSPDYKQIGEEFVAPFSHNIVGCSDEQAAGMLANILYSMEDCGEIEY